MSNIYNYNVIGFIFYKSLSPCFIQMRISLLFKVNNVMLKFLFITIKNYKAIVYNLNQCQILSIVSILKLKYFCYIGKL